MAKWDTEMGRGRCWFDGGVKLRWRPTDICEFTIFKDDEIQFFPQIDQFMSEVHAEIFDDIAVRLAMKFH